MQRILRTTVLILLCGFRVSNAQEKASHDTAHATDSITLRMVINSNYTDARSSRALVSRLMRSLPPSIIQIPTETTFHKLVLDQYNISIGPKASSAGQRYESLYDSVAAYIAELNPQTNLIQNIIPAGKLALPTLPPKAEWDPPFTAVGRLSPQVLETTIGMEASTGGKDSMLVSKQGFDTLTASPTSTAVLFVKTSVANADSLVKAATPLLETGELSVVDAPMHYEYGDAAGLLDGYSPGEGLLAQSAVDELARRLSAPQRRGVPLVLIESAWPDRPTALASCLRMNAILGKVRNTWGISEVSPSPVCDTVAFTDPPTEHSQHVLSSLKQLTKIGADVVLPIFVPMSKDQGAAPLLREIIRVSELYSLKSTVFRDTLKKREELGRTCKGLNLGQPLTFTECIRLLPDSGFTRTADVRSGDAMRQLRDKILVDNDKRHFEGSSAIVTAVVNVVSAFSLAEGTGAFVSTSWIVPSAYMGTFTPSLTVPTVLIVAAAGNDNKIVNNDKSPIELARWAAERQVIAVVNLTPAGDTVCHTSVVDTSLLNVTSVVGFDGDLERRTCGTSFSAPRVAWILAADEALRCGRLSAANWRARIASRLLALRKGGSSYQSLLLNPLEFVGQNSYTLECAPIRANALSP